jgi:hypothetical protein
MASLNPPGRPRETINHPNDPNDTEDTGNLDYNISGIKTSQSKV